MRGLQASRGVHVSGETPALFALASQSMRFKVNEPKLEPSHSVGWSSASGLAAVVQDCFPATKPEQITGQAHRTSPEQIDVAELKPAITTITACPNWALSDFHCGR